MENIWDNKWNNNRYLEYTGNPNLEHNRDSSGSRWVDILSGLAQGASMANPKNTPAQNYLDINYKGNGLAESSIKPIQNFDYQNPYLMGEYLRNNRRKNLYRFANGDNNSELGNVFNNVNRNKILGSIGVGNFINENYPTSIYDENYRLGDDIYNYRPAEFIYPSYLDGGLYGDFGKSVNDYFGGI